MISGSHWLLGWLRGGLVEAMLYQYQKGTNSDCNHGPHLYCQSKLRTLNARYTHAHTQGHTRTCTQTHAIITHTHAHHTRTHAHTHTHTRTHTHIHTRTHPGPRPANKGRPGSEHQPYTVLSCPENNKLTLMVMSSVVYNTPCHRHNLDFDKQTPRHDR